MAPMPLAVTSAASALAIAASLRCKRLVTYSVYDSSLHHATDVLFFDAAGPRERSIWSLTLR